MRIFFAISGGAAGPGACAVGTLREKHAAIRAIWYDRPLLSAHKDQEAT